LQLADSHACLAGEIVLDGHLDKHEPSALEQFADQHGWREQMLGDVGQDRQIETLPRKRLVESGVLRSYQAINRRDLAVQGGSRFACPVAASEPLPV